MAQALTLQPVSNREDWDETLELFDAETDTALDLGDVTAMTLILWDPDTNAAKLTASLGAGISIEDQDGIVAIHVDASEMRSLAPKNYHFRLGMVNGGATRDLILPGTLPIEDGGPT